MNDSDASTKSPSTRHETLTLSPSHNASSSQSPSQWQGQDQRKVSPTSSSIFSEDFEHWPGFDSHETFEDSGVDLEDQERGEHSTADAELGENMRHERWAEDRNSGSDDDDDPYSSAALSRRAEIILANAKKRLNVCAAQRTLNSIVTDNDRSWKETFAVHESRWLSRPRSAPKA